MPPARSPLCIDAGCLNLASTLEFKKHCKSVKKVYAFEPDPECYQICLERKRRKFMPLRRKERFHSHNSNDAVHRAYNLEPGAWCIGESQSYPLAYDPAVMASVSTREICRNSSWKWRECLCWCIPWKLRRWTPISVLEPGAWCIGESQSYPLAYDRCRLLTLVCPSE